VETVLAGLATLAGMVTVIYPTWFEALFDASPDAGSGAFEWAIASALLLASLALALLARRDFQRPGTAATR
jgi:hypothetical protein